MSRFCFDSLLSTNANNENFRIYLFFALFLIAGILVELNNEKINKPL